MMKQLKEGLGFLKSLKLLYTILLIGFFGFGVSSFVSAAFEQNGYYYVGNVGENNTNGSYSYIINNKINFDTEYGGSSSKSFYWSVADSYGNYNYLYNISRYDGKLYFLTSYNGNPLIQGFLQNICVSPVSSRGEYHLHSDCNYSDSIDILNNINSIDGFAFELVGGNDPTYSESFPLQFCFSNGNNDYCIKCGFNHECASGLSGNLNIVNTDFSDIKDFNWSDSPISSNGGGDEGGDNLGEGGISLTSDKSAINYFESKYGFDSNICYIGVNNMTSLWGSSVSFDSGTGLNIFQAYNELYGNSDLNKVSVWINNWLLNYKQWFGTNGNPLFLSNYNSGTNQVELYYDNLSFPFSNNPVGVYFMSSNIYNYIINSIYSDDIGGSEVANYCNIKINSGSYDDITNESIKDNIDKYTEVSNENKGLNSDGTSKDFILPGGNKFFTGTSFKELYEAMFSDFQNAFEVDESHSDDNGILPTYIIFGFLLFLLYYGLKR